MPNEIDKDLRLKEVEYGIDSSRRVIYLNDDFTLNTPTFLVERINLIADLSENNEASISIFLSSIGGDIYGMFGAIDAIRGAQMPINVVCFGTAHSAAGLLLISGTGTRALTAQSYVMLHTVQIEMSGSAPDIANEAKHTNEIHDSFVNICTKNSNKSAKFWKNSLKSESYYNANKCLEYELIDKIYYDKQT
jgi:ATP-dependent Clp protease, protease subunit